MKSNTLRVEKIINGGYGLARTEEGNAVLLRETLPGETLRYKKLEKRKGALFAQVEEILEQHPNRRTPPCPYYTKCGGCDLQHGNYEEQLRIKTSIVAELFNEMNILPASCVDSPDQFGYRQRIRLQIKGEKIGFFKHRSTEIVPINACLLAHPAINRVLRDLLDNHDFTKLCRVSSSAELLYNPASGEVTLLLVLERKPRPGDRTTATALSSDIEGLERIFFHGTGFSLEGPFIGPNGITSKNFQQHITTGFLPNGFLLEWEIGGFCQVNLRQNAKLIDHVLQLCGGARNQRVLDLYCGMGNFSLPLALGSSHLTGVEGRKSSVRSARRNCRNAGCDNIDIRQGDIDEVCRQLLEEQQPFDTIVLDPPRQGAGNLAAALERLCTGKLIYISCDPATLTRDLKELTKSSFTAVSLTPFDMFPQTHHIETVALLEKN